MIRRWAVLVALGGMLTGCATGSSSEKPDRPPERRALTEGRAKLQAAIERAFQQSEERETIRVQVRLNPPRCSAPAFEVYAHGKWTRSWLEGNKSVRESIEAYRTENSEEARPERFEVLGTFADRREAETGVTYPVFRVEVFQPER